MAKRGCNAEAGYDTSGDERFSPAEIAALDRFFAEEGRDLPWRRHDAGAWAVLVSEVMLQQTPVQRVLPVYSHWLQRWPTPADLAGASIGDVIRAWGRLGYPRRALRLQEAAAALVMHHGGQVPREVPALLSLPGVGEYTARAVAAFAYRAREPVVDTNVRRVLSRSVRGIDEHGPATAADRTELADLLPGDAPTAARISAALMELGALRCTVSSPACDVCPLAATCAWRLAGYPAGPPRRPGQAWHGTDRKMRGEIMAVLRAAAGPLDLAEVAVRTPSYMTAQEQWHRCLESLLADRLAVRDNRGSVSLP